jgi:methanogenic corrinoid protein MtbC1
MTEPDSIPTFNLKAVVRETGLKPDTLRAWERRYGLPSPDRSSGGHRLYSQRDVGTLKWLAARQAEGMSISRAASLWHRHISSGEDPLTLAQFSLAQPQSPALAGGEAVIELRDAWIAACRAFEEAEADRLLSQACAIFPLEYVLFEVLLSAMAEVGEGWYRGENSVQQEHFASEMAGRRLEALILSSPPPTRPGHILVACAPGDLHDFVPRLITLLMRRRGWHVTLLGANVPADHMVESANAAGCDLVVLSAQRLSTAAALKETAAELTRRGLVVGYGGRIFLLLPEIRRAIPGHYLGDDLRGVAPSIELLLAGPRPGLLPSPVPDETRRAREHFLTRRPMIEAEVAEGLRARRMPAAELAEATANLSGGIEAALALGDLAFLEPDLAWVQGLLDLRPRSPVDLKAYLEAYRLAVSHHLDRRGAPLQAWLGQAIAALGKTL